MNRRRTNISLGPTAPFGRGGLAEPLGGRLALHVPPATALKSGRPPEGTKCRGIERENLTQDWLAIALLPRSDGGGQRNADI